MSIMRLASEAQKHLREHNQDFSGTCEGTDFVMVAVSGTLEEGFPLRPNLDFVSPLERVDAVFLGRALIRGLRAKLDMKDPASCEYKAPPERASVNSALIPTGDAQDANISSNYLVDRRQAAKAAHHRREGQRSSAVARARKRGDHVLNPHP